MYEELVIIALGGNAIKQADEKGTTEEQFKNVDTTAKQITRICKAGYLQVLTHGNGPQAGALLIQQEEAKSIVPPQTLACCGAMTQGQIGWMFQNRIGYHFSRQGLNYPVTTMITQVVVDRDDPDFQDPSKPVGPFYTEKEAMALKNEKGYIVKEAKPGREKGWRRVVPSPKPVDIYEKKAIRQLLDIEALVIVSGGGGIPIVKEEDGSFSGVDAVIDKDLTADKLGQVLNADYLLILTDVENVYINFNKPNQKTLETITLSEAQRYQEEGQFAAGSMGPKMDAAMRFVRRGGKAAIITSLDKALDALEGKTGTRIVNN
ncbi:MAG: carbamate kinase [Desulfobacteraceae bacterium 4572_123]|nr:MAG: carbamate kinase [Desulfobacteraceae bacterium 4572_123]